MEGTAEFGKFIAQKRKTCGITLRGLATKIGIAPAFMSDIEKGYRYPPKMETLEKLSIELNLTKEEKNIMFDLAGKSRDNSVAPDLPNYIMNNETVRVALRMARDANAGDKIWMQVIEMLEKQEDTDN